MHQSTQEPCSPSCLNPQWDLALNTLKARALELALRDNWFSVVDQHRQLPAIADVLQRHPDTLEPVLDLLWAMGLLSVNGDAKIYSLAPEARHFWLKSSATYIGDAWLYRYHSLSTFAAALDNTSKSQDGEPQERLRGLWANAAETHLAQEQNAVTGPLAARLIRDIPEFPRIETFLDLGGGPGKVAVEIAKTSEQLRGCVFDFPEAVEVARTQIDREGLTHRLNVMGGDMEEGNFGGPYDLIWLSSVLHFAADPLAVIQSIFDTLTPGGVLVSVHVEIPVEAPILPNTLAWMLPLRMRRRSVWSSGSLFNQLKFVGFIQVESYIQEGFPMAPLTVVIGRRPI